MSEKLFHIYKSSAGSGKTRTLAKEYLLLALRFRKDYFKHILAVTFTNKATQEMKDRILDYLNDFAKGKVNNLTPELMAELTLDPNTFQMHAQEVQGELLHHYSQFSISTIDAFFQRVIRSFTRETGLMGDFRLEIDHDMVLAEVIDDLIDELKEGTELTHWVIEFAKSNLENERSWDIRRALRDFSEQIFKETFKEVELEVTEKAKNPNFFKETKGKLEKLKYGFLKTIQKKAAEAVAIIEKNNITANDFSYGSSGTPFSFFHSMATLSSVSKYEVKPRLTNYFDDLDKWGSKKSDKQALVNQLATESLAPMLNEIFAYADQHLTKALSAEVALNNFYAFGLVADIARKLREYKDQNNIMLLADAPQFLNGIIQDSDTPFIYEKVGSFYRNYLIDEFQDTSGYQWANFKPLLLNSLDQGFPGMLVGDVKQAVYRWRGGDLSLLQQRVLGEVGTSRVTIEELANNYRSTTSIVNFNNTFFAAASKNVAHICGTSLPEEVFETAHQEVTRTDVSGFVKVVFLEKDKEEGFEEQALQKLVADLESIQDAGVPLRDIAILVRKNSEGQKIAQHLLKLQSEAKENSYSYDVVSNESLMIDGASSVKLLLGAMRYLLNHDDSVARAQLAYEYARLFSRETKLNEVFEVSNATSFENMLPERFVKQKRSLKKLPLFEMTESLIGIFNLGSQLGELPFIQSFQDVVLSFYTREKNDLGAFLEWWEENRYKKSIQVPEEIDAIRILTIHKSKGLQFKVVMIPFCDWNLDHENMKQPTLWVKSLEPEFESAGFLPINYSSTLESTYFQPFYKEEFVRTYVDNLNLLYVALTRAEEGLFVTCPHKAHKGRIAALISDTISQDITLSEKWKLSGVQWEAGELVFSKPKKISDKEAFVKLSHYRVTDWREKMVIRQSGKTYFNQEEDVAQQKRLEGIHMHLILSRINTAEDVDQSLERLYFEGVITEQEKLSLRVKLESLFTNKKIKSWFDSSWTVRTEVPLLLPEKGERRIDRLMTQEGTAVVVDFKTGDPNKKDQEQVRDYIQWLHKMNFVEVNGFLLYLKTNQVVKVSLTKTKVSKVKDENQLGLGL